MNNKTKSISGTVSKTQSNNDGVISGTVTSCAVPNQARCKKCNKLLVEGFFVFTPTVDGTGKTLFIKCTRCKSMNNFLLSDYFTNDNLKVKNKLFGLRFTK